MSCCLSAMDLALFIPLDSSVSYIDMSRRRVLFMQRMTALTNHSRAIATA